MNKVFAMVIDVYSECKIEYGKQMLTQHEFDTYNKLEPYTLRLENEQYSIELFDCIIKRVNFFDCLLCWFTYHYVESNWELSKHDNLCKELIEEWY